MQTRSRVFDDLAKVANGAVSTLIGIKGEVEVLVRQQIERFLLEADMVPRDEFDAVKAMAAKARSEQEKLERRVLGLEARLGIKAPAKAKPKARKAAAKAAKSKPAKTAKKPKARRKGTTGAKGKAAKG